MPGLLRASPVGELEVSDMEHIISALHWPGAEQPVRWIGPELESEPEMEMDTEQQDPLMAGFQDCAAEAVRYLIEEEGRSSGDPAVVGLSEHLQARSAYLEYLSLLQTLETNMDDQLSKLLRSPAASQQQQQGEQQQQQQLTADQRRLVEAVFRGCDLVLHKDARCHPIPQVGPARPPSPAAPTTTHRQYFRNNDYLDQVLAWAHTTDPC